MHRVYHPYTDNGQVVAVPTTVNVVFTLGNKKQKAKAMAEAQAALAKATANLSNPSAESAAPRDK
jgi:hypothetical protein